MCAGWKSRWTLGALRRLSSSLDRFPLMCPQEPLQSNSARSSSPFQSRSRSHFKFSNQRSIKKFCSVEILWLREKSELELTERSKVPCLLTLMCRQIVRRRLRDHPAGLSVLSNMHSHLSGHHISPRIPVNIRGEIIPNTSFLPFSSSKNTGKKTIVLLSATSKKWIVSGNLWLFCRSLTSRHFKNSSAGSNPSTSIFSWRVPWNNSILTTVQSLSPPSIPPGSPAGIPVIITP